ncbi:MAG: hypothetical protein VX223_11890 [Myxococcota bacterium]|nr:hypothetical protein [Myxococcota bacterium]
MNYHVLLTLMLGGISAPPPVAERLSDIDEEAVSVSVDESRDTIYWETIDDDSRSIRRVRLRSKRRKAKRVVSVDHIVTDPQPTPGKREPLYNQFDEETERWSMVRRKRELVSPSAASDIHPAISRDGERLAFSSGRSGKGDIYIAKVGSTNQPPRLVARGTDVELLPQLAPDGKSLAFLRVSRRGQELIVLSDLDESPKTTVVADERLSPVSFNWRPDGKELAFYRRDFSAGTSLYVVEPGGGTARRRLTNVQVQPRGPAWLPGRVWSLVTVRTDDTVVSVTPTGDIRTMKTGTYGHGIVRTGKLVGSYRLAFTALGMSDSSEGSTNKRKVFLWTVPASILRPQAGGSGMPDFQ